MTQTRGSGLRLAGQGLQGQGGSHKGTFARGQGWKTGLGGTLIGLGTVGLGGLGGDKPFESAIGSAILGSIGGYLVHADRKKGRGMTGGSAKIIQRHFLNHLKKSLKLKTHAHVKKMIAPHMNKPIHISHIFGKDWKKHGKTLVAAIRAHMMKQEGEGIFDSIGKLAKRTGKSIKKGVSKAYKGVKGARDVAFHKIKQFADGKLKFKPNQLLSYTAAAVMAAGAASSLIPGVNLIAPGVAAGSSMALKAAALALKTSGRGKGGLPSKFDRVIKKDPKAVIAMIKKMQSGKGLISGTAKTAAVAGGLGLLYKYLRENPEKFTSGVEHAANFIYGGSASYSSPKTGKGTTLAGGKKPRMTKLIKDFMAKHPGQVRKMAKHVTQKGSGVGRAAAILAVAGLSASAASLATIEWLKAHPAQATRLATKAVSAAASNWLGQGAGCRCAKNMCKCSMTGSGKKFSALKGTGTTLAGGSLPCGCSYTGSGKVKKDRYSVYHGIFPRTSGGLTANDFILRGSKVISKKRQALGRKNMNFRRK